MIYGDEKDQEGHGIVADGIGNFVIVGHTANPLLKDIWLLNIDSEGNILSDNTFGGSGTERARSIAAASDGGYIISGFTRTFGLNLPGDHGFLVKTDENGMSDSPTLVQ